MQRPRNKWHANPLNLTMRARLETNKIPEHQVIVETMLDDVGRCWTILLERHHRVYDAHLLLSGQKSLRRMRCGGLRVRAPLQTSLADVRSGPTPTSWR